MPAKKPTTEKPARRRAAAAVAATAQPKRSAEWTKAMATFTKVHGPNIVARADMLAQANHTPTGVFSVDLALCGGFAQGYAAMLYGFESSGKTLLALLAVAGFQRKHPGMIAVFVDAEKLFDPAWAKALGVDLSRLEVVTPDTGEQAVDFIQTAMACVDVGFIIGDSVPSMVPAAIEERSAEDKTRGALAALMGTLCSKISVSWGRERRRGHYVSVILLNQWREIVGFCLGDPHKLPGGRQINHLPTTKLALRGQKQRAKKAKKGDKGDAAKAGDGSGVANFTEITVRVDKRKHGASIDLASFCVVLSGGHPSGLPLGSVDDAASVVVYAMKAGLVTGSGGHYRMQHFVSEPFRTKDDIVRWVRTSPKAPILRATLIAAMRQRHGLSPFPPDGSLECIDARTLVPKEALATAVQGFTHSVSEAEPTGDEEETTDAEES